MCYSLVSLLGTLGFATSSLQAQSSLSSLSDVGATNSATSPGIYALSSQYANDGSPTSAAAFASFTGKDRNGNTQTMTFTGSVQASAQYGQLHVDSVGAVTNTYYNASNPVYVQPGFTANPAGSPDGFASLGFADFSDTLQYGGALQAGYQARFIFHLSGTNSGYGGAADLGVTVGNNATEDFFDFDPGHAETDWATMSYTIDGNTPQNIDVQFSDQFTLGTQNVPDGSTLSGEANFGDTLTLAAIEIVDAKGDPVSGVTVTSASGTNYSVAAVPEPKTLALLFPALGWLMLAARRQAEKSGGALSI